MEVLVEELVHVHRAVQEVLPCVDNEPAGWLLDESEREVTSETYMAANS